MKNICAPGLLLVAASLTLDAQSIRLGFPADPQAAGEDILIMREYQLATGEGYGTMPAPYVVAARRRLTNLADIAIVEMAGAAPSLYLSREVTPNRQSLIVSEVTFNALRVLGISPAIGRDFTEADVQSGRHLAILTSETWQRVFGGRPDVLGTVLWRYSGNLPEPAVIVGVLPASALTNTPELDPDTEALVLSHNRMQTAFPGERSFAPIVRLRRGVRVSEVQLALNTAVVEVHQQMGLTPMGIRMGVRLETLRRR